MEIVFASNNVQKLREYRNLFAPFGVKVLSKSEAGADIDPICNGMNYEENAAIKARAVYSVLKKPCFADDNGLEIDALGGEPGIKSACYSPDGDHCKAVLSKLEGLRMRERSAKYICSICFINGQGKEQFFTASSDGYIVPYIRGDNGLCYDSIFYDISERSTYGEMTICRKNILSPRFKAAHGLIVATLCPF